MGLDRKVGRADVEGGWLVEDPRSRNVITCGRRESLGCNEYDRVMRVPCLVVVNSCCSHTTTMVVHGLSFLSFGSNYEGCSWEV